MTSKSNRVRSVRRRSSGGSGSSGKQNENSERELFEAKAFNACHSSEPPVEAVVGFPKIGDMQE
jgi:hypothetical protein